MCKTLWYISSLIQKWCSDLNLSINCLTVEIKPVFLAFSKIPKVPVTNKLCIWAIVRASLSSIRHNFAFFSRLRQIASASPWWRNGVNCFTKTVFDMGWIIICSLSRHSCHSSRPLQNAPFCPITASGSNFKPRNTQCIPTFKIFAFLVLEQNWAFFKGLSS